MHTIVYCYWNIWSIYLIGWVFDIWEIDTWLSPCRKLKKFHESYLKELVFLCSEVLHPQRSKPAPLLRFVKQIICERNINFIAFYRNFAFSSRVQSMFMEISWKWQKCVLVICLFWFMTLHFGTHRNIKC